ncbi:peptidase S8/S53 subtilisin kexin sedolisin [Halobacteriales archaeon QS_1_68_20]|nr:MAG: peptidase S8/S53 subtilisin kexin sedolisin [Halobacteriales archaeon QS_1_68_20]
MTHSTHRRTLLKGIVAGSTLTFAGLATAEGHGRYLVRAGDGNVEDRVRDEGFEVENRLAGGQVLVMSGEADRSDDLRGIEGVAEAAPDVRFELERPAETESADVDAGDGAPALFDLQWDKHVTEVRATHESATGSGSRLAIIDTGVDHTHQDLGNVNSGASVSIIDGEVGGHVGDAYSHGTHVAGITAATGAVGVLGTAPDAELVSVRVFPEDEPLASFSDILLAMEYAADVGADAANMSIGTPPIPPAANANQYRRVMEPVAQGVTSQGTLLVGSAGNGDANLQQGGRFTLPNSLEGVTGISATGPNDQRAFYSNYGTNEIDVGAPGGGYETLEKTLEEEGVEYPFPTNLVLSTVPGDGYAWFAGTSMAAPQVTGTAGLVREVAPGANANRVERAIKGGADIVAGENDPDLGAGRLNAADAVDDA